MNRIGAISHLRINCLKLEIEKKPDGQMKKLSGAWSSFLKKEPVGAKNVPESLIQDFVPIFLNERWHTIGKDYNGDYVILNLFRAGLWR